MAWYGEYGRWRPYVPVAKRRANAARYAARLAKKEKRKLSPITIDGRKIAESFWGQAWCDNLEAYSDFANRLPRGRTYVRNGSVIDLVIERGTIRALVSGSDVYKVKVSIRTLQPAAWKRIKGECSRSIDSLIDLLQGRFDKGIMQRLTQRDDGLFPKPAEIEMSCSCPDWAGLCKHVAAVLYGVGARLDSAPELLFALRDVDHCELIGQAVAADNLDQALSSGANKSLAGSDLGELFGIEISAAESKPAQGTAENGKKKAARKKPAVALPKVVAAIAKGRREPAVAIQEAPKKAIRTKSTAKRKKARQPSPVAAPRYKTS